MKYYFLYCVFLTFFTACKPSRLSNSNFNLSTLDSLSLKPSYEINNFRIDIVRQTTTTITGENNVQTENVPYHTIGFDLGNGLFYDLNRNLSFRLDHFLRFDEKTGYEYQISNRPNANKGHVNYIFRNDSLFRFRNEKGKPRYLYHVKREADILSVSNKRRIKESVYNDGESLYFAKNKRKISEIEKMASNIFVLNDKTVFEKGANNVKLGKNFIITQSENEETIQIKSIGFLKNRTTNYTLKKEGNKILVYNKKKLYKAISYTSKELSVYNSGVFSQQKLVEKHKITNAF